jgi:subtilase family serine protease
MRRDSVKSQCIASSIHDSNLTYILRYMKLGLQGVSVVYASGDSGVASRDGGTFAPGFPATCPYVTSVGATMLSSGSAVTSVEVAVSDPNDDFYSGGGFSNYFAAPSYQASALATYFAKHKPTYKSSVYNASGRGFPDVSALGLNIVNYDQGGQILQGGTSASAPIFASIITLINEQRLAAGKKPAGFLNPTLYANPAAFTDVSLVPSIFEYSCKHSNTYIYLDRERKQPWLRHCGFFGCNRLGPCDWLRNSDILEVVSRLSSPSVRIYSRP